MLSQAELSCSNWYESCLVDHNFRLSFSAGLSLLLGQPTSAGNFCSFCKSDVTQVLLHICMLL